MFLVFYFLFPTAFMVWSGGGGYNVGIVVYIGYRY